MRTKEFVSLERQLLSELAGFSIKGPLMFIAPVTSLLRGISFEPSAFDKTSFYVDKFIMPLCVPTRYLNFNFGDRVRESGGSDCWSSDMPNLISELTTALKQQAVPFLTSVKSLLHFVELAQSCSDNPHTPKSIAFALARAGRIEEAINVIDKFLPQLDLTVAWQKDIAELSSFLRIKLVTDPAETQQQLAAWEAESVHNLGLDEFR